jgi:hypothetical protein
MIGITAPLRVWHSRLGHPSNLIIKKLLQNSLLSISGPTQSSHICESCQVAKCRKLPFPTSTRVSTTPLELIHSDVWSSPIMSVGGCRYYVVFIDDYSRFTWMFPLQNKSDVFLCFIKFKNLVENLLSCKIKQLQSDNGGEYISNNFKNFLETHGILH